MNGPLKIKNTQGPKQKFEAECHLCNWAFFKWTIDEARQLLLWHLDRTHITPPPPFHLAAEHNSAPMHLDARRPVRRSPWNIWVDC